MKKTIITFIITIGFFISVFSQQTRIIEDKRDGYVYKTVKIGEQWWMSENLAYKPNSGTFWAYNNDDAIRNTMVGAKTLKPTEDVQTNAKCT